MSRRSPSFATALIQALAPDQAASALVSIICGELRRREDVTHMSVASAELMTLLTSESASFTDNQVMDYISMLLGSLKKNDIKSLVLVTGDIVLPLLRSRDAYNPSVIVLTFRTLFSRHSILGADVSGGISEEALVIFTDVLDKIFTRRELPPVVLKELPLCLLAWAFICALETNQKPGVFSHDDLYDEGDVLAKLSLLLDITAIKGESQAFHGLFRHFRFNAAEARDIDIKQLELMKVAFSGGHLDMVTKIVQLNGFSQAELRALRGDPQSDETPFYRLVREASQLPRSQGSIFKVDSVAMAFSVHRSAATLVSRARSRRAAAKPPMPPIAEGKTEEPALAALT